MDLDRRSTAVLKEILDSKGYIPIHYLSKVFNVSRRTIYNDLKRIDNWLQTQGFAPVEHVRSSGLYIEQSNKENIWKKIQVPEQVYYEFSPYERRAVIALYLLTGQETHFFLADFINVLGVSRNTVLEDIKQLKEDFVKFQVSVQADQQKGYVLLGSERSKRQSIVYFLSKVLPEVNRNELLTSWLYQPKEPYALLNENDIKIVQSFLFQFEKAASIEFTDDVFFQLSIRFTLFIKRIKVGTNIEVDRVEKQVVKSTSEYKHTKIFCKELEKNFEVAISEEEVIYLTAHLLSSRVNYSDIQHKEDNRELNLLQETIRKMVHDFEKHALIEIEDKRGLEKNLLTHLKPAYYRLVYGIDIENDLADSVQDQYPEVYELTKRVVPHFEQLVGKEITKNEIAYIAMHFGGWLRKEGTSPEKRRKMLIVCSTGLGTSKLLEKQLKGLFNDVDIADVASLREYERMNLNVDMIISTISLRDRGVPVFVVNPILSNEDKERLLKEVNISFGSQPLQRYSLDSLMNVIRQHASIENEQALEQELSRYLNHSSFHIKGGKEASLTELLPERRIMFQSHVKDWREAIERAAESLKQEGYITKSYITSMIQQVEKHGPYIVISPKVAIPHATPEDGVNAIGMSMLTLGSPVFINDKEVKLVIVLATVDDQAHLKALSQLTSLFSDKSTKDRVLSMQNPEEVFQIIQQYSSE